MAALRSRRPAGVAVSAWPSRGDGTRPFPRRSPRCSELAPSRGPILGASRNKGGAVMAIPSRIRAAGRVPWRALSRTGRISVAGGIGAGGPGGAPGITLPRVVGPYALASRLESIVSLVRILEQQDLVPPAGEDLTREAYDRFDATVRGGLLGGENLRVTLWNREGEIVYSDRLHTVGRRLP